MKRICSWCNKDMGVCVEARSGSDQVITHGICEACATEVLADIEAVELDAPDHYPGSGAEADGCSANAVRLAAAGQIPKYLPPIIRGYRKLYS